LPSSPRLFLDNPAFFVLANLKNSKEIRILNENCLIKLAWWWQGSGFLPGLV
jgi:hypothetical protein